MLVRFLRNIISLRFIDHDVVWLLTVNHQQILPIVNYDVITVSYLTRIILKPLYIMVIYLRKNITKWFCMLNYEKKGNIKQTLILACGEV